MAEHTPGPWHEMVEAIRAAVGFGRVQPNGNEVLMPRGCYESLRHALDSFIEKRPSIAAADAAPELLAALRVLANRYPLSHGAKADVDALHNAGAAIAKAEGRE